MIGNLYLILKKNPVGIIAFVLFLLLQIVHTPPSFSIDNKIFLAVRTCSGNSIYSKWKLIIYLNKMNWKERRAPVVATIFTTTAVIGTYKFIELRICFYLPCMVFIRKSITIWWKKQNICYKLVSCKKINGDLMTRTWNEIFWISVFSCNFVGILSFFSL